uniref:Uncharacterized protein n=1 Tax=Ixodes ricinus TaxID=34613 RepID=A0A6B0UYQ1_IXORI
MMIGWVLGSGSWVQPGLGSAAVRVTIERPSDTEISSCESVVQAGTRDTLSMPSILNSSSVTPRSSAAWPSSAGALWSTFLGWLSSVWSSSSSAVWNTALHWPHPCDPSEFLCSTNLPMSWKPVWQTPQMKTSIVHGGGHSIPARALWRQESCSLGNVATWESEPRNT